MTKSIHCAAGLVLALAAAGVSAQPTEGADQAARKINPYVYMRDAAGDKVFLETQFWRNDPNYDARSLHRISEVMAGLEKLRFQRQPRRGERLGQAGKGRPLPDQHGSRQQALARQDRRDRQLRKHRHFRGRSRAVRGPEARRNWCSTRSTSSSSSPRKSSANRRRQGGGAAARPCSKSTATVLSFGAPVDQLVVRVDSRARGLSRNGHGEGRFLAIDLPFLEEERLVVRRRARRCR